MYLKEISPLYVIDYGIKGKDVIIWGIGNWGEKLYQDYVGKGVFNCLVWCDSNPTYWGEKRYGIKIISPAELMTYDKKIPIIIAMECFRDYEDVAYGLQSMGFSNLFSVRSNLGVTSKYNITEAKTIIDNAKEKIKTVYSFLHDQISINVFCDLIRFRLTNEVKYPRHAYDICKSNPQYFPPNYIFSPDMDEVFIDAGCYDTSTIKGFMKWTGGHYKKIYAFEPDPLQYMICKERASRSNYNVDLIEAGLYKNDGTVGFSCGYSSETGHILEYNDTNEYINTVSVDSFFEDKNDPVTFIKMDIEGAEIDALEGARATINKFHPKLAICIYHKFSDLWEIPILVNSLCSGYKIYIRHHSTGNAETVLYARWDDEVRLLNKLDVI